MALATRHWNCWKRARIMGAFLGSASTGSRFDRGYDVRLFTEIRYTIFIIRIYLYIYTRSFNFNMHLEDRGSYVTYISIIVNLHAPCVPYIYMYVCVTRARKRDMVRKCKLGTPCYSILLILGVSLLPPRRSSSPFRSIKSPYTYHLYMPIAPWRKCEYLIRLDHPKTQLSSLIYRRNGLSMD